jgi:RecA-family ATPase
LAGAYEEAFFGRRVNAGRVVIVTAEDPELILNRRFVATAQALAAELETPYEEIRARIDSHLSIVSTFGHSVQLFRLKSDGVLLTTDYYTSLVDALAEVHDLQLVVIDTKTRFSPGEGLGNVTATQEITHYEAIAHRLGCGVMLLHHSNKISRGGVSTGATAYRDATALFDSVRAAWYLRALTAEELVAQGVDARDEGNYLLLENSKNNYVKQHDDMVIRRDGFSYSLKKKAPKMTAAERKEAKKQMTFDTVIAVIQGARTAAVCQADIVRLCREIGVGRNRVLEILADALSDGLIEAKRSGRGAANSYELTDAGRMYNNTIEGGV